MLCAILKEGVATNDSGISTFDNFLLQINKKTFVTIDSEVTFIQHPKTKNANFKEGLEFFFKRTWARQITAPCQFSWLQNG